MEIHANHKKRGFGRAIRRTHARSFPWTFSAGTPDTLLSSTPGSASPMFRTVSKSIVLLGIVQHDLLGLIVPQLCDPTVATRKTRFFRPSEKSHKGCFLGRSSHHATDTVLADEC
jgi:hypothetical protein